MLPSTITEQEKIDFELKICKLTGIKDNEGNLISLGTTRHSDFIEHPTNGTYIYAINGFFNGIVNDADKASCAPTLNFSTATDDALYDQKDSEILEFFHNEEEI